MRRARSPIEMMVYKACGFDPDAPPPVPAPRWTSEELRHWSGRDLAKALIAVATGCSDAEIARFIREAARRIKARG